MEQPASQNQPETTQNQPAPPIQSGTGKTMQNIMAGMALGILIGVAGLMIYQRHLPAVTQTLYTITLVSFGVLILTFVLLLAFKKFLFRFLFGKNAENAGDLLDDAQRVSDALTDQIAEKFLADAPADVRQRVRFVLPKLTNWFVWGRMRNWWWQWILGIFVSLGGLTGTLLLMNQNELLKNQNTLIQRQMYLDEASRRSALVVLMSNIMDKVDDEIAAQKLAHPKDSVFSLSQSLIGQIAALSHSFKPYRYLEGDTLIAKPLSPERGQLLITLAQLPLDTITFKNIFEKSIFQNAELRDAQLSRANLRGVNLIEADLEGANLIGAGLMKADLRGARLRGAGLMKADLRGADLLEANLREANLREANLKEAYLELAHLSRANLEGADLTAAHLLGARLVEAHLMEAILTRAYLGGTDLMYADLTDATMPETEVGGANLMEADLKGAKISINQLIEVRSLYNCRDIHDSIKTALSQSHPHLFEKPKEEND